MSDAERKTVRYALIRMFTATGPVGTLAFWSATVEVQREDRDIVCKALEKILHDHPEWGAEES